ncbi:MAG TPA: response regulator [Leptospiraceae bacterium]|nr:response regulator [Leptospiraceae bacterium]HMX33316.1 response regulator [Leptospiraceae bacterium]HMY32071.1 response regulator [Leptospiraceae bacterium]HMZ63994.1 response regulator [Leptospiraceae bacterium]HNA07366.1 response regulator [Leptospiraceae bacterium]
MSEKHKAAISTYKKIYKTFIVTVILLIVSSQAITQFFIYSQKFDSNRINIAGRQRMLSQNIAKTILKIHLDQNNPDANDLSELENLKNLFMTSDYVIQNGSKSLNIDANQNDLAQQLFKSNKPHFDQIILVANTLLQDKKIDKDKIKTLFESEKEFLKNMDLIVTAFNEESIKKSTRLQIIESLLAIFAVIIILIEIGVLYRPLIQTLIKDNEELSKQKKNLEEFSFVLSHKLRKHVANLLGLMNSINPNNLLEIREYFQYVRQSVYELDTVSRELGDKATPYDLKIDMNSITIDSTKRFETIETLKTILLIDDDKITNILTKRILVQYNPQIKVDTFTNPYEGLRFLEKLKENKGEFPIVFLDITMPEMTGWEFLDKLAGLNINPPVYILTSSIDRRDIERARVYKNVKSFLTKPLTSEKMPTIL